MKNIKLFLSNIWSKISIYFYGLLALAVVFGCIFLVYAAATGLWNSLGETVQSWVAGGVTFYIVISVLGCFGGIAVIVTVVAAYSALIAWLYK